MNRRRFVSTLGALGMVALVPALRARRAVADGERYEGPFLIVVHAGGGWDPTMFFDGKEESAYVQVPYGSPATLGKFTYAPLTLKDGATTLGTVQGFLSDLGSRLLILNGIDTQTNNHRTGVQHVWSGKGFGELPSLGALFAAAKLGAKKLPVAYVSAGGYEATADLVALTRLSSPAALRSVSLPNVVDTTKPEQDWLTYHDSATYARIQKALGERYERLRQADLVPAAKDGVATMGTARAAMAGFDDLALGLPATPIETKTAFPELGGYNDAALTGWLRAVETALYAFSVGQAASANIATGAFFDTHSAHDTNHSKIVGKFFLLLRFLFRLADDLGLSDKLYVVVGSDFGRTPMYNAGGGKDHWNVTSMAIAGPGVTGGRVLGGTDEQLRPLRIDPSAPTKLFGTDDASGTRLHPAHVHRAFRRLVGIEETPEALSFQLPVDVPLDDLLG